MAILVGISISFGAHAQNSTTGAAQQMMKKNSYPQLNEMKG
jgi:hypothetical protein